MADRRGCHHRPSLANSHVRLVDSVRMSSVSTATVARADKFLTEISGTNSSSRRTTSLQPSSWFSFSSTVVSA